MSLYTSASADSRIVSHDGEFPHAFEILQLQPTLFDANDCCRHAIQVTLDLILMRFSIDLRQAHAMWHLLAAHESFYDRPPHFL